MNKKENKAHLTAISRKSPSLPTTFLANAGRLQGKTLDYGCGRGFDSSYFGMSGYDPHFFPKRPTGKFKTIVCNYVLNVVKEDEAIDILKIIKGLLAKGGTAYLTVRRDRFPNGYTSKGTYQRMVYLNLPVLTEKKGAFVIYELKA
jgi:ATP adenylyltransferase